MTNLSLLVSLPDAPEPLRLLAEQLAWDRDQVKMARQLFKRGLPPLVDTHTLPYIFGVRPKFLSAMGHFPERYYRRFSIAKHGGGVREIESPRRTLKVIQQWLNRYVVSTVKLPPCVMGFVTGRNIFDNARPHAAGRNLMVVDIETFFPSVRKEQIVTVYREIGFPSAVQEQLSSLSSLEGRLPQGASTSPALANIVFRDADAQLQELASSWGCLYSRYADDLAFSGDRRFGAADARNVERIVRRHGFSVNRSKSRRIGPGGRQIVTGLVINESTLPPRWKRRLWRSMFYRASKHPREFANREKRLRGIAAFVNQYDASLASEYRTVADAVAE